ncbi:MAG: hypothetical protein H0V12_12210 [Chloroflexi bacterium]|nr:hypothetical protein [Chloroflexota bacterium]
MPASARLVRLLSHGPEVAVMWMATLVALALMAVSVALLLTQAPAAGPELAPMRWMSDVASRAG